MLYARFLYPDNGNPYFREKLLSSGLVVGERYRVIDVEMGQSSTYITLDGFGLMFNSVYFEFENEDCTAHDIFRDPKYNRYMKKR